jgi:hypothetical protein
LAGFEHALFILLLLSYLLRETSGRQRARFLLIAGGLLLALLPPFFRFDIPWNVILALVLPLFFWQNAQNWLRFERRFSWQEVSLMLITAFSLTAIVGFLGNLPWARAFFFGIVASSMLWQAMSPGDLPNLAGNIGQLTLVFLLVETSLPLGDPSRYFGSLFSGAGVGIALALLSIAVIRKMPRRYVRWISIGQIYLAYWIATAIGASEIAAALINIVVIEEFLFHQLDDHEAIPLSARLDDRPTFFICGGLFIFTAWQMHQPVTPIQWVEVFLGLCVGFLVALLGKRIGLPRFDHLHSPLQIGLKPGLFLLGVLILWPRGPELESTMIWIALGLALSLPGLSALMLAALQDMKTKSS